MYVDLERLTQETFKTLVQDAKVLVRDSFGDKVYRTPSDDVIKVFRVKRFLSSARWYPYALRFANNAKRLDALGITTIDVTRVFRVPEIARTGVVYKLLPGQTLRDGLVTSTHLEDYLTGLSVFLAKLHNQGIYFRSIHFGNLLVLPDGTWGLIDVADMRFRSRSLSQHARVHNFRHMTRHAVDRDSLSIFGFDRFVDLYLQQANVRYSKQLRTQLKADFLKH